MKKWFGFILLIFIILTPNFIMPSLTSINAVHAREYPEFHYTRDDLLQEFINELSNGTGMGEKRELLNVSEEKGMVTYNYHGYVAVAERCKVFVGHQSIQSIDIDSFESGGLFNWSRLIYSFHIDFYPLSKPKTIPLVCYYKKNYTLDGAIQAYINDQKRLFKKIKKTSSEISEEWSCNYQVNLETYNDISIIEWFFASHRKRIVGKYGTTPAVGAYSHGLFIVLDIKPPPDHECYSGIFMCGSTNWHEGNPESKMSADELYDPDALKEDMWDWVGLIARMLHKETGEHVEKEKQNHLQVLSVESPSSVMKGDIVNVNAILFYNFSQSTASYVAIQNLVTGEDIAFKGLSLSGSGNLTVSFQFLVNESATLHLSAYALYFKDENYTHDDEGWCLNFDINVEKLTASFMMEPENPIVNETITFTSNSTGNIVEYRWFLDGKYLTSVGNSSMWIYRNATAGSHTVELIVVDADGNTDAASLTFHVEEVALPSNLALTATTDKSLYITKEKIVIKGKVTYGEKDMSEASVNLKIHFPDGTMKTWPGGHPDSDGSFTVSYDIPIIPFKAVPPEPEDWNIEVIATYQESGKKPVTASTTLTVKVLPIWLKFHGMHLVQVIEVPAASGCPILAASKEAGVRVIVSCPCLKEVDGASKPKIKVKFTIDRDGTKFLEKEKEVEVGSEPTQADFIFRLPEGAYTVSALVDSDYKYMDIKYMDDMLKVKSFRTKKMKTLDILFLPIRLDLKGTDALLKYFDFCRKHEKFMRSVYPLPDSNLKFLEDVISYEPPGWAKYTSLRNWKRYNLLKWLSLKSVLEGRKIVGVLPDSKDWWGEGEQGYSSWIIKWGYFDALYWTRAVLVRYGAVRGVTAHEIGHTLGLNRYREEYDIYPYFGKEIKGLILKDGHIYNVSRENEKVAAFGPGTGKVYCFMGSNPDYPSAIWVCDETYKELFKYLKDPPEERILYISGIIYKNNTVKLDNCYILTGEPDIPIGSSDEGKYKVQCISSSGKILYSANFGTKLKNEFMAFGFSIPFPNETSTVVIKKDEKILNFIYKTPNSPVVEITKPSGGEVENEILDIKWKAVDPDGDKLYYSILYSYDGGERWIALAIELNETKYTVDLSKLPGGDHCLIKVVANDGFNTGFDISESFTVTNKTPLAIIKSPKDGEKFQLGEEVSLKGIAYDLEDMGYKGLTTEWSSSLDGILGYGEELKIDNLSEGRHEITFTVTDSAGNVAEDKIIITIGEEKESFLGGLLILEPLAGYLVIILIIITAILVMHRKSTK